MVHPARHHQRPLAIATLTLALPSSGRRILQDHDRGQLPADERHVLEARVEAAMLLVSDLREIRRARAVLASEAQALDDAGKAGVVEIVAIRSS